MPQKKASSVGEVVLEPTHGAGGENDGLPVCILRQILKLGIGIVCTLQGYHRGEGPVFLKNILGHGGYGLLTQEGSDVLFSGVAEIGGRGTEIQRPRISPEGAFSCTE